MIRFLSIIIFLVLTIQASAVVVYTHSSSEPERYNDDPIFPFPEGIHLLNFSGISYDLDFNQDGYIDFTLENTFALQELRIIPQGDNAALAIPAPPPNLNSFTLPVEFGQTIDEIPLGDAQWLNAASGLIGCQNMGCIGLFAGRNYIGTQFDIAGEQHFGWIEMDVPALLGGGVIISWAYESEPGVPIIAGAIPIPEPSVYLSLLTGLAALTCCRRKYNP